MKLDGGKKDCCVAEILINNAYGSYGQYGAFSAFLSPQQRELRRLIRENITRNCKPGTYNVNPTTGIPEIKFSTKPYTEDSNALISDGITCEMGGTPSYDFVSFDFSVPTVKELALTIDIEKWEELCCGVDTYLASNAKNISISGLSQKIKDLNFDGLIKDEFQRSLYALLKTIETDALNAIIAGVGLNPVTGSTAPLDITLAVGSEELMDFNGSLRSKIQACDTGRLILLTGTSSKIRSYMNRCGKLCCNTTTGIDPNAIVSASLDDFDWYRSTLIDTMISPNAAFVIFPDTLMSATLENFAYMGNTASNQWGRTSYGSVSLDGTYCSESNCVPEMGFAPLELGMRVRELDCSDGKSKPAVGIALDTRYGFGTRPTGSIYADGVYDDFTGIIQLNFV